MDEQALSHLSRRLELAAGALAYPPTPNLAAGAALRKPRPAPRLSWALAAAALALAASLLTVPSVRARVADFLRVGGIEIRLPGDSAPKHLSNKVGGFVPYSGRQYGSVVLLSDLSGEMSLAEARRQVNFEISLPAYPPTLGAPDRVYVQGVEDAQYVILAWLKADDPSETDMALYILGPGARLGKGEPEAVSIFSVNGNPAALVIGNHFLMVRGEPNSGVLVQAPALIWESGGLTYRIEANWPIQQMLLTAESIQ